jgi:hypothetical protein
VISSSSTGARERERQRFHHHFQQTPHGVQLPGRQHIQQRVGLLAFPIEIRFHGFLVAANGQQSRLPGRSRLSLSLEVRHSEAEIRQGCATQKGGSGSFLFLRV